MILRISSEDREQMTRLRHAEAWLDAASRVGNTEVRRLRTEVRKQKIEVEQMQRA